MKDNTEVAIKAIIIGVVLWALIVIGLSFIISTPANSADSRFERLCSQCGLYVIKCGDSMSSNCVYCRRMIQNCPAIPDDPSSEIIQPAGTLPVIIRQPDGKTLSCFSDKVVMTPDLDSWKATTTCKTKMVIK